MLGSPAEGGSFDGFFMLRHHPGTVEEGERHDLLFSVLSLGLKTSYRLAFVVEDFEYADEFGGYQEITNSLLGFKELELCLLPGCAGVTTEEIAQSVTVYVVHIGEVYQYLLGSSFEQPCDEFSEVEIGFVESDLSLLYIDNGNSIELSRSQ
jgi:hypothetical protein